MLLTMQNDSAFTFLDPGPLCDKDLELVLVGTYVANPHMGYAPSYTFEMRHVPDGQRAGRISVRIGTSDLLVLYAGQMGYGVEEAFRGRRFAARSCRLVLPLLNTHGINPLWITCNPENIASRRTCEILGAQMIEIVDLPTDTEMYRCGERRKCRYRLAL